MPDQSDWSEKRIAGFARFSPSMAPEAVLRVPDRNIEARIYPDSLPGALEGGLSRVTSTQPLASGGNTAIAGHRDSYFRRLEDIPVGTAIEIVRDGQRLTYLVVDTEIVDALDVTPLDETDTDRLTLITCHPFYYEGYAPDRFIVRADLISSDAIAQASP